MFDFAKDIGGKLFGNDEDEKRAEAEAQKKAAEEAASQELSDAEKYAIAMKYRNEAYALSLAGVVSGLELEVQDLAVTYSDNVATVSGQVQTNEVREKIILALGNISEVGSVDDQLEVLNPEPEAVFYVVQKGDSLSKIAKEHYGDFKSYTRIFEANRPMLSDPDLIYPGQTLRIPPK
jgi:nucleoid-associated protein YgaU